MAWHRSAWCRFILTPICLFVNAMIILITLISPIKTKFGLICAYIERIEKQIDLIDSRVSALKMSAKLNCKNDVPGVVQMTQVANFFKS